MSAANRKCKGCGADISSRDVRATYCSPGCRRAKPCQRCGGHKGDNLSQGSRFCGPCQEVVDSGDHQRSLDRARRRRKSGSRVGRVARRAAPDGQKWCAHCQRFLPVTSFTNSGGKLAAYCIPCQRDYNHERMLVRRFGITPERYAELLELQDGRCAICLARPRKRRLAVDHDHQTGEVRGLLCTRCNHGILGKSHDSAEILQRAVSYLVAPPSVTGRPITEHSSAVADLEFMYEQVPFLNDGDVARHRDGHVAVTGRTFVALAQAAGWAITVNGQRLDPPPQLAIDDMQLLETFVQLLTEAGYQ